MGQSHGQVSQIAEHPHSVAVQSSGKFGNRKHNMMLPFYIRVFLQCGTDEKIYIIVVFRFNLINNLVVRLGLGLRLELGLELGLALGLGLGLDSR